MCIHADALSNGDLGRVELGDLQESLERLARGNAGEIGPGCHLAADFDGDVLQHSFTSGPDVPGIQFLLLQLRAVTKLVQTQRYRGQVRSRRLMRDGEPLVLDRSTNGELLLPAPR